ncbi:MAG: hypothetical protein JXX29_20700, partial [Deltaproteobacteria bacterium]|nr:hypothetical protein [Deltaproteobacteria bacterium]
DTDTDTDVVIDPIPGGQGTSGTTTRYWDCCVPHCAWGRTNIHICDVNDDYFTGDTYTSSCDSSTLQSNDAFQCSSMAPWQVGANASYGFAAFNSGNCGDCYQLDFQGSLAGKSMIVQVVNIGDIGANHFDLLIPGGGLGYMTNGCPKQFPGVNWGTQYGGWALDCGYDASCTAQKCNDAFSGAPDMLAGCLWYTQWLQTADNPSVVYKQVSCPAAIGVHSGI